MTVQIILVLVFLVIFAIASIAASQIMDMLNDDVQADADLNSDVKSASANLNNKLPNVLDAAFMIFFVIAWIVLLFVAFFAEHNPLWLVVGIIFVAAILYVGVLIGNTYEEVTADGTISTFADNFPMTNFIIENIAIIILVMAASSLLAMYGRSAI